MKAWLLSHLIPLIGTGTLLAALKAGIPALEKWLFSAAIAWIMRRQDAADKILIFQLVKWAENKLPAHGQGAQRYAAVAEFISHLTNGRLSGDQIKPLIEEAVQELDRQLQAAAATFNEPTDPRYKSTDLH